VKLGKATITTTSQATEDMDKVLEALSLLLPPDTVPTIREYEGYHGNPIRLITLSLEKKKVSMLVQMLKEGMLEQTKKSVCEGLAERMDENGVLHLRFDKQKALFRELVLTEGADSIVVSIKFLTYPRSRDAAINNAREMFCE